MKSSVRLALCLALFAVTLSAVAGGQPKTSQHESFKPEDFARIAVIVKPIAEQSQGGRGGFGYGGAGGGFGGGVAGGARRGQNQSQLERLVEQNFLRVVLKHGYTLVSRTDLDAAMVEKGLDEAKMTDEKYSEEAGKLLHVSAIMVVSVTPMQAGSPAANARVGFGNAANVRTYYQLTASMSARLIKISDNMVMWTGDFSVNQSLATEEEDSILLGSMAEAIATAFPPLVSKKE